MLVSARTWDAGLLAALSLEIHSQVRWPFVFHDDGSLPAAAIHRISRMFPESEVVPRSAADARASEFLARHPRCLSHRSQHNLMLKFLDTAAWARTASLIVLDSDVIFFRHPREILDWIASAANVSRYNEDTREKFCIPRPDIEKALAIRPAVRFNSGLVLLPTNTFDLDLAESLLAAFESTAHAPQFFEQTLYALMATRAPGGAIPLPRTYEISWGYWRASGSICRHYVGEFKHDLLYIEGAALLLLAALRSRLRACRAAPCFV
jgi:hypothetical protein